MEKPIKTLVVDTTAFIQNEPLLHLAENIVTVADVVSEIRDKRQLRRLCVLPYQLIIKDVFPENVKIIANFSKKTGDYPSLSATDIKVMALTYQLEKELNGTGHLRMEPTISQIIKTTTTDKADLPDLQGDYVGFYDPDKNRDDNKTNGRTKSFCSEGNTDEDEQIVDENDIDSIKKKFGNLDCEVTEENEVTEQENVEDILTSVKESDEIISNDEESEEGDDEEDEIGWVTPANVKAAKKQANNMYTEEKSVKVACMTTDFAMQNVLKQMNLNVSALDGRIIKQLRTFILRCYTCFKTTSIMTHMFCPKCGNNTLKKVSVSVDSNGKQVIFINNRRPLTARGKKFSLPTMKGGKYSRNPILVADQPMPDQRPTRIARTKTNALDDDYLAGYSPFAVRDVNSKSAMMKIRSVGRQDEVKHWMKNNPNASKRRAKK